MQLPFDDPFPIVVVDHPAVMLLIEYYHKRSGHQKSYLVLNELRQKIVAPHLRAVVKPKTPERPPEAQWFVYIQTGQQQHLLRSLLMTISFTSGGLAKSCGSSTAYLEANGLT